MNDTAIQLNQEFSAPLQDVWNAWTQAEQIAKWWGPEGFATKVVEHNFKPQGTWRYVMTDEQSGTEYPAEGVFVEITEREKIVTTDKFDDADLAANPNLPKGIVLTVEFAAVSDDTTNITITIQHPSAEEKAKHEAMGVVAGWQSSFDSLNSYLQTK
jgi:uncharacterized protein YndB with AHSA1/START domain